MKNLFQSLLLVALLHISAPAVTYHIDAVYGDDGNSGLSASEAWKSLAKANGHAFNPGDVLVLKRGGKFDGGLVLSLMGTAEKPVVVGAYGEGPLPRIDAKGRIAGVHLVNSRHVVVRDLSITADGGKTVDGSKPGLRHGVFVQAADGVTSHVTIERLEIDKIYPEVATRHEGRNPTTYLGMGIAIEGERDAKSQHFTIRGCRISGTGFKGISLANVQHVEVLDNQLTDIGGPGIQPGRVDDLVVRGNTVIRSGSGLDPRMHARGSGIWPWTCNRVLIERNRFFHARGKGDSCGVHIDYNCRDVIVQYNLSVDNEGGFAEILGNNHNCVYRYNISVNDGSRVKGENGAQQEGKIIMISGYVGDKMPKKGPYNSYIYNNTIFMADGTRSCFSIGPTTQGLLIANNVFHVLGTTLNVHDDQDWRKDKKVKATRRAAVSHNLYANDDVLPGSLPFKDANPIFGDARFLKAGSVEPADYVPGNVDLVKDRGIAIRVLDGSDSKPGYDLNVAHDFLGNPIKGNPDLGAIELP